MTDMPRPLSPHLQIYKWQVQMMSSILHRITGIALSVGTLLLIWGLVALAGGEGSYANFKSYAGSIGGTIILILWSLALFYHLCNGIRHLLQDAGAGYAIPQFVRSSWLSIIGAVVLTAIVWIWVFVFGGGV